MCLEIIMHNQQDNMLLIFYWGGGGGSLIHVDWCMSLQVLSVGPGTPIAESLPTTSSSEETQTDELDIEVGPCASGL